jgi:hypothetical protein
MEENSDKFAENDKETTRVLDVHHRLKFSKKPWNACTHNMKLMNHHLTDKWILVRGTCPVKDVF